MTGAPEATSDPSLAAAGQQPRPPLPTRPPSRLEQLLGPPLTDRTRAWAVTLALTTLAALVRFWGLGSPTDRGTPVFDEKHYVPQAWQMLRNGGFEDNPGYELTVHPPLAKQLMAIGEAIFGYNAWGWRFASALLGALCVLLLVRIVRRMTRSTLLGAIAGVLLIADGVSHVQSRIGMLDIFVTFFVLAAFGALVVDRDQVRERLAVAVREGRIGVTRWGPRLGFRWWRFGAGVLLGLACGSKWSGAFFLAAFAVMNVLWDYTARRAAGVEKPLLGTVRRDLGPALWALAVVPIAAYLATWWAWFAGETPVDRHTADESGLPGIIPDGLRALLYYNSNVLSFHESLTTPADPHPWESKPWTWLMGLRPMLYYYEDGAASVGCGQSDCVSAVMLIGTPAIWWLSVPVLVWALWRAISWMDWRYAAVLVAYAGGYLPWWLNLDRQMYFFYMTPLAPFLVLGLTLCLGEILGRAGKGQERRSTGLLVVALYVGIVVANFIWLWPILVGDPITPAHWNAELWLPSWR